MLVRTRRGEYDNVNQQGRWSSRETYRVRTRSNGERINPVVTAAAAATKSEAQGYGDAISMSRSKSSFTPRSGTLKRAQRRLRDQFSSNDWSTV